MRIKSSPNKLSTPKYSPVDVDVVATVVEPVAISALIIVPVAPEESVMVTLLLLKSIASSLIMLSQASVDELSVPSNAISPSPVSSSNKKELLASVPSESVPSRISRLPNSSVDILSFSSLVLPDSITT